MSRVSSPASAVRCRRPWGKKKRQCPRPLRGCARPGCPGHQLQFELAAAVQLVKRVAIHLARKAANDLAHPPGLQQRGHAVVGIARVVVNHRQIARALLQQAVNQHIGNARRAKAPDQHRGTVFTPASACAAESAILLIMQLFPAWPKFEIEAAPHLVCSHNEQMFAKMNYKALPAMTLKPRLAPAPALGP